MSYPTSETQGFSDSPVEMGVSGEGIAMQTCIDFFKLGDLVSETNSQLTGNFHVFQLDPQVLQDKDWQRTVISMNGVSRVQTAGTASLPDLVCQIYSLSSLS